MGGAGASARAELGKVTSVNPAKLEARARLVAGLVVDVAALSWAWFLREGAWTRYKVAKAAGGEGELRLQFAPGVPKDIVRSLQGLVVAVDEGLVLSRGPLWRRVREMIGLAALRENGARLGTVTDVFEGPKSGAIKVESDDGMAWVLPVVEGAVIALNTAAGTVVLGDFEQFALEEVAEDGDAH